MTLRLLSLVACGFRPGSPPVDAGTWRAGAVEAPGAEPGLADALRAALSRGLAARGGGLGPLPVSMEVVEASTAVIGTGVAGDLHRARLVVAFRVYDPAPRRVVLEDERSYVVRGGHTLEAAQARAEAFATLAEALTEDAIAWLGVER